MRRVIIAAVATLLPACANAANITINYVGSRAVVFVTGIIQLEDGKRFINMTDQLPNAIVSLRSPGGNALAGMGMGAQIRTKGFATYVSAGSDCLSSCAIIWLGGAKRLNSL